MTIKLRTVMRHYKTKIALAKDLRVSKQAVSAWAMDKPIPEKQELKLRYEVNPKIFKNLHD